MYVLYIRGVCMTQRCAGAVPPAWRGVQTCFLRTLREAAQLSRRPRRARDGTAGSLRDLWCVWVLRVGKAHTPAYVAPSPSDRRPVSWLATPRGALRSPCVDQCSGILGDQSQYWSRLHRGLPTLEVCLLSIIISVILYIYVYILIRLSH